MVGFEWLGELAHWIADFFPRWEIVDTTRGAVKFVRGNKVVPLGPGMHFYWPLVTVMKTYPTVRQAVDLRTQTIVTADDRTVAIGGMIVYEIVNIESIVARTYDPDQTVKDISISAIHDVCCTKTWAELKDGQRTGSLDRELRAQAKKELDKYGVRVLKTTLTDMAPCRVLKLINSQSKDES